MKARVPLGVKVATVPEQLTVPATAVEPGPASVNAVAGEVRVAQFNALLKVALTNWFTGTPVAPSAGVVAVTAGRDTVVNDQM